MQFRLVVHLSWISFKAHCAWMPWSANALTLISNEGGHARVLFSSSVFFVSLPNKSYLGIISKLVFLGALHKRLVFMPIVSNTEIGRFEEAYESGIIIADFLLLGKSQWAHSLKQYGTKTRKNLISSITLMESSLIHVGVPLTSHL